MFKRRRSAEGHAEVNVVPFIDLLSVCISFMLLTAVWIQAGALSTKQGLGTEAQVKSEKSLSVWLELESANTVLASTQGFKVNDSKRRLDMESLNKYLSHLKKKNPDLQTAVIFPNTRSSYNQLIRTMDTLKKSEFRDIGISPL